MKNASNPEWNQSFNILCYQSPRKIQFHAFENDSPIGHHIMSITDDYFKPTQFTKFSKLEN